MISAAEILPRIEYNEARYEIEEIFISDAGYYAIVVYGSADWYRLTFKYVRAE